MLRIVEAGMHIHELYYRYLEDIYNESKRNDYSQ